VRERQINVYNLSSRPSPLPATLSTVKVDMVFTYKMPAIISVITGWSVDNTAPSATCQASSVYSNSMYQCSNAITQTGGGWASIHEGVGAWIKVQFEGLQFVKGLHIQARCSTAMSDIAKTSVFEFDDGSTQLVMYFSLYFIVFSSVSINELVILCGTVQ
jgi:hypothetical protein